MKALLFLGLIFITTITYGQTGIDALPQKDGRVIYYRTEQATGQTQQALYTKAKQWLLGSFGNTLQIQDSVKGQLAAKGFFSLKTSGGFLSSPTYRYNFTVRLSLQDDGYNVQLYNITYNPKPGPDATDTGSMANNIPIEIYITKAKSSGSKSVAADLDNLNLKFINLFFTLRDRINNLSSYNPTLADVAFADLIKKKVNRWTGATKYTSPDNEDIQIFKQVDSVSKSNTIYFSIKKSTRDNRDHPLNITFDDGTVLKLNPKVTWVQNRPHNFTLSCYFDLEQDNIQNFKQKTITNYQVDDENSKMTATLSSKVKAWVNYLDSF